MDLTTVCITPSPVATLVVLFCLAWPFVVLAILKNHGRSAAPVLAMLLPLAGSAGLVWLGIINTLRGMAVSGAGGVAAVAAGFAESLSALVIGAGSAAGVAVAALIRRHRPVVDRVSAVLVLLFVADVAGALLYLRQLRFPAGPLPFLGVGVAVAVVAGTAVWLFLVARGLASAVPLPGAAPLLAAAMLVLAFAVWSEVRSYTRVAIGTGMLRVWRR